MGSVDYSSARNILRSTQEWNITHRSPSVIRITHTELVNRGQRVRAVKALRYNYERACLTMNAVGKVRPTRPGLGYELDWDWIAAHKVATLE